MKARFLCFLVIAVCAVWALGIGRGSAAAAPPPLLSSAEILTPDQIRPGMTGYGKTVFRGSQPETFGITVLGVMRRWDFDADIILIRITSGPVVTRGWGIVSGMSGSPIYVNGKLVGALAFAWTFSKEPIAGVTPIRLMAENYSPGSISPARPLFSSAGHAGLPAAAEGPGASAPPRLARQLLSPTPLPARDPFAGALLFPRHVPLRIGGRRFHRAQLLLRAPEAAPADPHTLLLTPIATPVMVNGLSGRSLRALQGILEPYGLTAMAGAGKSPVKLTSSPLPGAAIGIQLVGGDIDMTAVGTVTHIKHGRILAMGHPFLGTGPVNLPMVGAYVHGILPSQRFSFKLSSGGDEVIGRWTEDRLWSIGGVLGEKPPMFPGTFAVRDAERGLRKKYSVTFSRHRDLTPMLAYLAADSALASIAPPEEGTLRAQLEVSAHGLPPMRRQNLYSRPAEGMGGLFSMFFGGGADSPGMELLLLLDTLENNPFGPAVPERITLSAEWRKTRQVANIEEVRARTKRVRPGDKMEIQVLIQPWDKPKETRLVEVEVPRNVPPGKLQVGIAGGLSAQMIKSRLQVFDPSPVNLAQQMEILTRQEKNNDLLVEIAVETSGVEVKGRQMFNLPQAITEVLQFANVTGVRVIRDHLPRTIDMPYVLSGGEVLTFLVETDEKEKAGRGPSVSAAALEMGLPESLLRGLLEIGGGGEGALRQPWQAAAEEPAPEANGEQPSEESPPEMPSLEELEELEAQEPETISAEKPAEKPKGKALLRGPSIWKDTTEKDFAKGKTFGSAVNSSGQIDLAPAAKTLYSAQEGLLWAQATDGKGNLYVGSWLEGKVKKISVEGSAAVVLESPEPAISALACDSSGNLYAAAAPSGSIHKIDAEAKVAQFCRLSAPYIWDLLADGEKGLLAATGPEGKLFRISPEGKAELLFQAPDRHIISLASSQEGVVYLATCPKGKVYRIVGDKAEPFYETPPAVTALSLALDAAGNLYVGTSPSAQVIRIDPRGQAKLLFKSPERHIFSLCPGEDGSVYAATGPRARIWRIFPDGSGEIVWEAKAGHVVNMVQNAGHLFASLAGARQILRLDLKGEAEGTFLSGIHDAGGPSRWGQIRWESSLPEGTVLTLQTRSGNTAFPDSTWSEWSSPYGLTSGEQITSPPARYLQYRASFRSANASRPSLRQFEAFYLPRNRPPEVKLLSPLQSPAWAGKQNIKWSASDPDKDSLTYQVFYSADEGKTWVEIKEPVKKAAEKEKKAEEMAENAAGGNSEVFLPARKKPEPPEEEPAAAPSAPKKPAEEKPLAPTKATSISWDTTKVADGVYLIKVIASDRSSNPKEPLSDEKISEPFRIDNTPPMILLDKRQIGPPPSRVKVIDGGTYVASAEYRIDKGEWTGALAEDGIYDGQVEEILIENSDLPSGEHVLQVRARDGVGNEAVNEVKYRKP